MKPTQADVAGLNISVARFKNVMDSHIINVKEHTVALEVKSFYYTETSGRDVNSKQHIEKNYHNRPLSELSNFSKEYITYAKKYFNRLDKENYEQKYLDKLDSEKSKKYSALKKGSILAYEEKMQYTPEYKREPFDVEQFNIDYDAKFYADYKEPTSDQDEWAESLSMLSKLRIRFSANSKIFLSAFTELLLQQLITNGTYNCIKSEKRIIKLGHALKINNKKHFPLADLVVNTQAYKDYQESQQKNADVVSQKGKKSLKPDEGSEKNDSVSNLEKPNFNFYIMEICRSVRMKLASGDIKIEGDQTKDKNIYNTTNVGDDFKQFCNRIIFEIANTLGRMIMTEIKTRGVKTLSDTIAKTTVEQIHNAHNINFKNSLTFISHAVNKYSSFIQQRRDTRKSSKF
jgi:hypothetical protein